MLEKATSQVQRNLQKAGERTMLDETLNESRSSIQVGPFSCLAQLHVGAICQLDPVLATQIIADQLCVAMPMGLQMDEGAWPLPALLFQIRSIRMATNGTTVGSGRYIITSPDSM
jgi:hypothetical protein